MESSPARRGGVVGGRPGGHGGEMLGGIAEREFIDRRCDRTYGRRTANGKSAQRVVACIDVQPISHGRADVLEPDILRHLAVQRVERCLRPDDWICIMGDGRLAVCFGHGAHRAKISALANRLASALGDHLSVGAQEQDLAVAIGIGSGSSLEMYEVATAAIAASDAGGRLLRRRIDSNGSTAPSTVVWTNVRRLPGAARLQRRDVVSPGGDRDVLSPYGFETAQSANGNGQTRKMDLKVQIVGFDGADSDFQDPTVEVLLAAARQSGVTPSRFDASAVDASPENADRAANEVVVLALGSEAGMRNGSSGPSTPWERWAQLTRSFVRAGTTVLAVGMGASVAAVAMCVREGAVGILDLGDLAEQLEKISVNMASRRLAVESGSREASRGTTRSALPSPYNRLVDLTASEHRVLYQMMRGVSASEIADELVVSLATVRSHIRSILRKLQVSSQLAAVALANGVRPDRVGAA